MKLLNVTFILICTLVTIITLLIPRVPFPDEGFYELSFGLPLSYIQQDRPLNSISSSYIFLTTLSEYPTHFSFIAFTLDIIFYYVIIYLIVFRMKANKEIIKKFLERLKGP